jgi:predicted aldo/keto reductase-like oxidoreductase
MVFANSHESGYLKKHIRVTSQTEEDKMQYRELIKGEEKLSVLGYGCMRFPQTNGKINEEETEKQILYAIKEGINYFDTAYPYHGGKSEVVLGNILEKHNMREDVYIADKMPSYLVRTDKDIEKFFNTQLERLKTNYIDYYLMHTLDSLAAWERLKKFGMIEYIEKWKKEGKIKHIGFSFHGRIEEFKKIVDDYDWEFCQIQYNYLDENYQAGTEGLEYAYAKGLGVIIMEPLRGGSLSSNVPDKVKKRFENYSKDRSPAEWALKWLWNQEEVSVILSGMNVLDHVKENMRVASETHPNSLKEEEIEVIDDVKEIYKELMKVPCTGCNYCMPCPFGVDIPGAFSAYNDKYFFDDKMAGFKYVGFSSGITGGKESGANLCKACGKCEKVCPQHIKIIEELKNVDKELDSKLMRFGIKVFKKIKRI